MAVLLMLVERPGEVITRQEFIETIWAEEYGGDESLARAVSHLRKVFADISGENITNLRLSEKQHKTQNIIVKTPFRNSKRLPA